MVDKQMAERKRSALAAAQSLLADFQADPELFAIPFFDKDDFLLIMEKPDRKISIQPSALRFIDHARLSRSAKILFISSLYG
jgi:hypothetical protein